MSLQSVEAEIVKDINAAVAIAPKVAAAITNIKGSALEPILEKVWPGIANAEATVLSDLSKLSDLGPEVITWLSLLFPKPAA